MPEMISLCMAEMGLAQKSLAELLEVSPPRISEYLNGKSEPTLKVARQMYRKLDIDPEILLG
ncbi:MAG: helix-turn-helix transcriptional regulator [Bacteroidales bacterium]